MTHEITHKWIDEVEGDDLYILIAATDAHQLLDERDAALRRAERAEAERERLRRLLADVQDDLSLHGADAAQQRIDSALAPTDAGEGAAAREDRGDGTP